MSVSGFFAWLREARLDAAGPILETSGDRWLDAMPDADFSVTKKRLQVRPGFFTDETYLAQGERADWQFVDRDLMMFAARLVEKFRSAKIPLFVHGAFRSREQQERYFLQGTSKVRWPRAAHCQGAAVDIVHSFFAWELSKQEWAMVGKVGKDLAANLGFRVVWGGDWKNFPDPAHWELPDWRDNIRELSGHLDHEGRPMFARASPRYIVRNKWHKGLSVDS